MKRVFKKKYILVLIVLISIGFAYLPSNLSLTGISSIFGNTWDVHFENVQVTSGSVQANTPVISNNDTSVTFTVVLEVPGDFYEFTVDAVNGGTIDAMLDTYTSTTLTEDQQKYLEYTATYADGEALAQYQELNAGDTLTYKIRLFYKLDIQEDDLPSEDTPVEITFTSNFIQADSNRIRRRAENTLYNVLKNEAESNGLAKKYTGEHQDSMDASLSTKDIYHWYATNDTEDINVNNKNNVSFAGFCWKMIRTTDTGGTKLIYNGVYDTAHKCSENKNSYIDYYLSNQSLIPEYYYGTDYIFDEDENKYSLSGVVTTGEIKIGQYTCKASTQDAMCTNIYYVDQYKSGNDYYIVGHSYNNTLTNYHSLGYSAYNYNPNSPASVGYMYNDVYDIYLKSGKSEYVINSSTYQTLNSTDYWYSTDFVWGSPVEYRYNLVNPSQINDESDYSSLVGKYTFLNNNQDYTSYGLIYIIGIDDNKAYYIQLLNGNDLSYYNTIYTYGDTYTDNNDGTYTINNPSTISKADWFNNYASVGANKYVCKNAVNNSCDELWYTLSTTKFQMNYKIVANANKCSNSFEYKYDPEDGMYKYFLDEDSSVYYNVSNDSYLNRMSNAHYTCFNNSGKCSTISYIFMYSSSINYYFNLENGDSIEDIERKMFYDNQVNTTNSKLKSITDQYFKRYLNNYTEYIEDTIYCNDRSIKTKGGWDPNGGNISNMLRFSSSGDSTNLKCTNITDMFSISNEKAKLIYPIGHITSTELNLLNHYDKYYTGFTMTPLYVSSGSSSVQSRKYSRDTGVSANIFPVISLNSNSFYSSGDGTQFNPYMIDTN